MKKKSNENKGSKSSFLANNLGSPNKLSCGCAVDRVCTGPSSKDRKRKKRIFSFHNFLLEFPR